MPRIGEQAPQFSLPSDGGNRVNLSDYAGKKVVLYFYPKDDTPGCTKEACDFRDNIAAVRGAGAEVLGISPDSSSSHDEFKAKYQLPFPLLVDEDHAVADAYGAWREKTLYGRTFMGIERTTVLIDEQGRIAGVWQRVQVDGHVQHVLAVLRGEQPAPVPADVPAPAKKSLAEPKAIAKAAAKPAAAVAAVTAVAAAAVVATKAASKAAPKAKKKKTAAPAKKKAAAKAVKKKAAPAKKKAAPAKKKAAPAKKKAAPAKKKAAKKSPKKKK